MKYPILRTVEDVRKFMEQETNDTVTDDQLGWFNCVVNARSMSDYNLKDMAWMLKDGIEPMGTLDSLQNTLYTYFEDMEDEETQNLYLVKEVFSFIGKMDNVQEIEVQLDQFGSEE